MIKARQFYASLGTELSRWAMQGPGMAAEDREANRASPGKDITPADAGGQDAR
jgi:hypothetical protein